MRSDDDIFARMLDAFVALSEGERTMISDLSSLRIRHLAARTDIVREGEIPGELRLIRSGMACRYKMLEDGRRQIIGILLPGDIFDLNAHLLRQTDHSIAALSALTYADLSQNKIDQVMAEYPSIARAIHSSLLAGSSIQREWALNLGQRTSVERIGHLFCEIFVRLRAVGLTKQNECSLPLTQLDLADATGMTPVHVSRTLRELRSRRLVGFKSGILTIPDLTILQENVLFTENYLHLYRRSDSTVWHNAPRKPVFHDR